MSVLCAELPGGGWGGGWIVGGSDFDDVRRPLDRGLAYPLSGDFPPKFPPARRGGRLVMLAKLR